MWYYRNKIYVIVRLQVVITTAFFCVAWNIYTFLQRYCLCLFLILAYWLLYKQ